MTDCQKPNRVVLASKDMSLAGNLREKLRTGVVLFTTGSWSDTLSHIESEQARLLLLDPRLADVALNQAVSGLSSDFPELRIIILTPPGAGMPTDEVVLYKAGAHGFLTNGISTMLLNKAVHAVCNGELWMPRSLITRIIEDLAGARPSREPSGNKAECGAVECLTPRELQVARMVHLGGNNKTIARELSISERTVKAHLSAIFRKLNIQNRLHLALFLNDVT
jgi:two-component system nitrate/nitrite response regulator NarL